jgi:hypothetical protein
VYLFVNVSVNVAQGKKPFCLYVRSMLAVNGVSKKIVVKFSMLKAESPA